jgi:hypothetical protein
MFLSKDALEKLNTKRLLAYKKMLLKYSEYDPNEDSWSEGVSKSSASWKAAYDAVKAILATREHIEK